ncbi:MAG: LapA family protein [Syntrophales bacterium]|nr:LapA family protein [Syntrophales bacterium]
MKVIYTIIVVLVVLFIITFSLENTVPVQLKYYDLINVTLSTYLLVFIVFLVGVVFTGFMGIMERYRLNRTMAKLNRTLRDLRREIKASELPPSLEETVPTDQG